MATTATPELDLCVEEPFCGRCDRLQNFFLWAGDTLGAALESLDSDPERSRSFIQTVSDYIQKQFDALERESSMRKAKIPKELKTSIEELKASIDENEPPPCARCGQPIKFPPRAARDWSEFFDQCQVEEWDGQQVVYRWSDADGVPWECPPLTCGWCQFGSAYIWYFDCACGKTAAALICPDELHSSKGTPVCKTCLAERKRGEQVWFPDDRGRWHRG